MTISKQLLHVKDISFKQILLNAIIVSLMQCVSIYASSDINSDRINELLKSIKSGEVADKLTDPNEIVALLGEPHTEKMRRDGGMEMLTMCFPNVEARFSRFRKFGGPFTLGGIHVNGKEIELEEETPLVLRNLHDLSKMNFFYGLQNVSLKKLDLRQSYNQFRRFSFDTLTQWPTSEKLPMGFDPAKLLEEGKNPGLGIHELHEEGINGENIGIAIFDQPLLLGHEEYTSRITLYNATEVIGRGPTMHGPPIVSVAVGKTCGVAPEASVFYYAAGTTSKHQIQANWINEVITYNKTAKNSLRIRVISISASPETASNNEAFLSARKKALDAGILVVTCSPRFLDYGTLKLIEGKDPDDPNSYVSGGYCSPNDVLRIPVGNGTTASHRGNHVYTYYRKGGMSWAAPYIAGLAAMAFQVDSDLEPQTIVEQLIATATLTKAGPVVNPRGFIKSIKKSNDVIEE